MPNDPLPRTLAELLGIDLPILGGPMGGVAGPELVAAVSGAGGLGLLGHANIEPAEVRRQIRRTRELTDRPFGIGLLFPSGTPPRDRPRLPLPSFLQDLAAGYEQAEVPADSFSHELAHERLSIAIEEKVSVLSLGLGAPPEVIRRAQDAGMKVVALVGSLRAALEVERLGVDVIVAQGHESGGHTGRTSTMVLVPQVTSRVKLPVLAAGGIMDGRGMAAAIMLGASGVLLGTRLLATPEARTAQTHKDSVVAMSEDDTVVSRCYTGKPSRVIRNRFVDAWRGHENEILPMPAQWERVAPFVITAKKEGSLDLANWPTGQGAVLVDEIQPAADVVTSMAAQARQLLQSSGQKEKV